MTWGDVKRGDVVLEVYTGGRKRIVSHGVVKSVGKIPTDALVRAAAILRGEP